MVEPNVYQFAEQFNQCFLIKKTQLLPGSEEPFYKASSGNKLATIYSNQDFFSSALHEIAHWCIAGESRRTQDDYGYWYAPDGRNNEQQKAFYQVEIKPQALEWAFHLAANWEFKHSLDNLDSNLCEVQAEDFKQAVHDQLNCYFDHEFPESAKQVIQLLCRLYRNGQPISQATINIKGSV